MRKPLLMLMLFIASLSFAMAQRTITGKVTAEDGLTLPGVSVVVKGTLIGTVTDASGNYSINVQTNDDILIFSFVGMRIQEVAVGERTIIDVQLASDLIGLDEIVVIGYGTVRRGEVTGAISSVSGREIRDLPVMDAGRAIQGRASGVMALSAGNRPGEGVTIRIRGRRSLTASNEPLYVVDGVPYAGNINDINPGDIVSIEVLKDASATAIYGSRGANGVILITTARGGLMPTTVSYNGYYGITTPYGYPDFMTADQYAQLRIDGGRTLTAAEQSALDSGVDTDWLRLLVDNGFRTNHQLSIRGGDARTGFNVSIGMFKEQGVSSPQDITRQTLRLNLDHAVSARFRIGTSIQLSDQLENRGSNFWGSGSLSPLADPYYPDGSIWLRPGDDPLLWNPLTMVDKTNFVNEYTRLRVFGNIFAELDIARGLTYRLNFGPDFQEYNRGEFRGRLSSGRQGGNPDALKEEIKTYNYTFENILNFSRDLSPDHSLGLTGLFSIQEQNWSRTFLQVRDLPYEHQRFHNLGTGETILDYLSDFSEWGIMSFMGRLNYSIMGKYLFTLTARYDGSSVLADENKWGFFPSAAFLWRVGEEDFMANQDLFSDLGFRMSYGVTGNSAIDPYQTRGGLSRTSYSFGQSSAFGYRPSAIANSDLKWESSATFNIGVDFGIGTAIVGSFEVYQTNTTNLLLERMIPITSGFNSVMENIGETQNRGWELSLSGRVLTASDFSWDANINVFGNKEKIVDLYGTGDDDIGNQWFIGHPLSVWYDYEKIGIWQLGEETEAARYQATPGIIKIRDQNDDFVINHEDRVILGSDMPTATIGFGSNFRYKDFDMAVFVLGIFGHTVFNNYEAGANLQGRYNHQMVDYWTPTNPTNAHPIPDGGREYPLYSDSRAYMAGDFVKIRNIQLGYTLPRGALSVVGVNNLRMYVNIDTPFIFSNLHKSLDPERYGGRIESIEPTLRTYSLGLNVSF